MKNLIISLIAMTAILSSCTKEQQSTLEQNLPVSRLSATIQQYVENNYPDASISSATVLMQTVPMTLVTLNTSEELAFDQRDSFVGDGELFHHDHMGHGKGHGHDNDHDGKHGCDKGIPVDSIPAAITAYVNANFSAYTIMHAEIDSFCSTGAVYEIMIRDNVNPPIKLVFDLAGNYLFKTERIDYANVPQVIKDQISTNFPGYLSMHRCEEFVLLSTDVQYRIFAANGTTHKTLIYSSDGKLICEQ